MKRYITDYPIKIDWIPILFFVLLVGIGWVNIYSASSSETGNGIFDLSKPYGKQLVYIILSLVMVIVVFAIESKFYERFSVVFYLISIVFLLGIFVFGKKISGATSWFVFGGFSLQPSEFAKVTTVMVLAKYLSDGQINMKNPQHLLTALLLIIVPALLVLIQPDAGSALVFLSLILVLYLRGMSGWFVFVAMIAVLIFLMTLLLSVNWVILVSFVFFVISYFFIPRKKKMIGPLIALFILCSTLSYSVDFIFKNVFEQRHRDRFNIVLGLAEDKQGIGFNTYQSKIAIGSGGFWGKGYLEGTQTKGNFVPAQHTDYIFTTVGEEWGFLGSAIVILLFAGLLFRLLFLTERQKTPFAKWYGYGLVTVLFIHFMVNIGMVIGLIPTIGIPLPFFSYGGSALWGFTLLLFIFLKLDGNRVNEW
ncbi:MAG: rod shape-determining protein RodA [Flavobacteriales bacterium CG_4_9_14_3_um_filter_40_17]|nr:MAG: rod shape-determining protein RodA [Flavobacteriales bacterium CG_4_9_14_3_um_filter_40_17]